MMIAIGFILLAFLAGAMYEHDNGKKNNNTVVIAFVALFIFGFVGYLMTL